MGGCVSQICDYGSREEGERCRKEEAEEKERLRKEDAARREHYEKEQLRKEARREREEKERLRKEETARREREEKERKEEEAQREREEKKRKEEEQWEHGSVVDIARLLPQARERCRLTWMRWDQAWKRFHAFQEETPNEWQRVFLQHLPWHRFASLYLEGNWDEGERFWKSLDSMVRLFVLCFQPRRLDISGLVDLVRSKTHALLKSRNNRTLDDMTNVLSVLFQASEHLRILFLFSYAAMDQDQDKDAQIAELSSSWNQMSRELRSDLFRVVADSSVDTRNRIFRVCSHDMYRWMMETKLGWFTIEGYTHRLRMFETDTERLLSLFLEIVPLDLRVQYWRVVYHTRPSRDTTIRSLWIDACAQDEAVLHSYKPFLLLSLSDVHLRSLAFRICFERLPEQLPAYWASIVQHIFVASSAFAFFTQALASIEKGLEEEEEEEWKKKKKKKNDGYKLLVWYVMMESLLHEDVESILDVVQTRRLSLSDWCARLETYDLLTKEMRAFLFEKMSLRYPSSFSSAHNSEQSLSSPVLENLPPPPSYHERI